jgi:DNA polymerase-3 subunit epsilon
MFRHLRLCRPLVFIDLETTGTDPWRDRVVELAMIRFAPGRAAVRLELRVNPGRSIPLAASAVHGIRDEHIVGCPSFAARAGRVQRFLGDADLAGFGIARFDLPMLASEISRAGWRLRLRGRHVVDALALFHRLEPRDLTAAVRRYCGRSHEGAHGARADALAAAAVLDAMLGRHAELPRDAAGLHRRLVEVDVEGWFRRAEGGAVVFGRGKHRDAALAEVARRDPSYLCWLLGRALPDAAGLIESALSATDV